jgi:SAM-dependent methyltransferase
VSGADSSGYGPEWLALREGADADARAVELLEPLRDRLAATTTAGGGTTVVRDLGCGTGSMGRWLAPRLPGPQHWVLQDRDPGLLDHAAAGMARSAADGAPVTAETRQGDIARLTADDLAGTALVTASALLDLLTADEVDRVAAACADAGCAALFTLSVTGRVALEPAHPLDGEFTAAFNAHQRRGVDGRRLLGPDAVEAAADAFARRGATVRVQPSPWRLGPDRAELAVAWLRGRVAAATAQRPELAAGAPAYLRDRLAAAAAGELSAVVDHGDLLADRD